MNIAPSVNELRFRESFHPEFLLDLGEIKAEGEHILAVSCSPYYLRMAAEGIYQNKQLKPYLLAFFADPEAEETGMVRLSLFFRVSVKSTFMIRLHCRTTLLSGIGSIVDVIPVANWMQREISELYGVKFTDKPFPALILHAPEPNTFNFVDPKVVGQHQVAVGPIHAGIIEPGHLRFFVRGEKIYSFQAHLFYSHRGLEKMAVGKTITEALVLAEHVCGLCACTHAQAFCQAVENFYGLVVPQRARFLRAILLELERLNYHSADLAAICASGGLSFGSMQAAALREILLRRTKSLTGHRFFRGIMAIGGLKRDIGNEALDELLKELKELQKRMGLLRELITTSDSLLDRLETTGTLPPARAVELGLTGPSARGSGIDFDLRRDGNDNLYQPYNLKVPVYQEGDCWARTMVRLDEWSNSVELIRSLVRDMPDGDNCCVEGADIASADICCAEGADIADGNVVSGRTAASGVYGVAALESAKGETVHFVRITQDGRIARWHLRSASYLNWGGMVAASSEDPHNIVADGPLINKSFNLCYACSDK